MEGGGSAQSCPQAPVAQTNKISSAQNPAKEMRVAREEMSSENTSQALKITSVLSLQILNLKFENYETNL